MNEKEKEEFLNRLREQAELLNGEFGKGNVLGGLFNLGNAEKIPDLGGIIFGGGKDAKLEEVLKGFLGKLGTEGCTNGECDKDCAEGECQRKGVNPLEELFGGLEGLTGLFGGLTGEGLFGGLHQ